MTRTGCGDHEALADELRQYAVGALNLLEPWLDQLRERQVEPGDPVPATCAVCPLCAMIALFRGERSELAARLAEQAAGLLAVLRAALVEGVGGGIGAATPPGPPGGGGTGAATPPGAADDHRPGEAREVRRIPVSRVDGGPVSRVDGGPASAPC